jgi:hypothetical protein
MATVNKTFVFNTTDEGWNFTSGGKGVEVIRAGVLCVESIGRNNTDNSYFEWTGTWEDLGVPAGSTVTEVGSGTLNDFDWRVTVANVSNGGNVGPFELRDSTGVTILGTFSAQLTFGGSTTSWATRNGSAVSVPSAQQPSNSTIRLRIEVGLDNANDKNAETEVELDNVALTLTYSVASLTINVFDTLNISDVITDIQVSGAPPAQTLTVNVADTVAILDDQNFARFYLTSAPYLSIVGAGAGGADLTNFPFEYNLYATHTTGSNTDYVIARKNIEDLEIYFEGEIPAGTIYYTECEYRVNSYTAGSKLTLLFHDCYGSLGAEYERGASVTYSAGGRYWKLITADEVGVWQKQRTFWISGKPYWTINAYSAIISNQPANVDIRNFKVTTLPFALEKFPTVQNDLAISEFIEISSKLFIDVAETISIQDSPVLFIEGGVTTLNVNVFDEIKISNNNTQTKFEATTRTVSVFDLLNIQESITGRSSGFINVFDTLRISESINGDRKSFINVFDVLSISENITVRSSGFVNVFELLNITDARTVSAGGVQTLEVNIYDTINISEFKELKEISGINVYDVLNISELRTAGNFSYVNVNEIIFIDDAPQVYAGGVQTLQIDVFDTLRISESVTAQRFDVIGLSVNVFELLNITDAESVYAGGVVSLEINVYEVLRISESKTGNVRIDLSVYDVLRIEENITVSKYDVTGLSLSVVETVFISGISEGRENIGVSVYDVLRINEFIDKIKRDAGVYSIYVNESLFIQDIGTGITLDLTALAVNVYDSLRISEGLSLITGSIPSLIVNIIEQINLQEWLKLETGAFNISVSDSIVLTDEDFEQSVLSAFGFDTLEISEITGEFGKLFIEIDEEIFISELVVYLNPDSLKVNVFEIIRIRDRWNSKTAEENIFYVKYDGRVYEVSLSNREFKVLTDTREIRVAFDGRGYLVGEENRNFII